MTGNGAERAAPTASCPPRRLGIGTVLAAVFLTVGTGASSLLAATMMVGDCEPTRDPLAGDGALALTPALCLKGGAGGEAVAYAERAHENTFLSYGSIYGGTFVTPWVSAHVLARWRDQKPMRDDVPETKQVYTDYAVLQIGNPVLNKVRLTGGHLRLPFGIDNSEAPQSYQILENRLLWHSPTTGGYITYDDLKRWRFDIGGATSLKSDRHHRPDDEEERGRLSRAVTARAMLDISALEGTRLVASLYGGDLGERRFGFGMVNVNHKTDTTTFEFVRRLTTPSGKSAPFEQVIRLGYVQAWQGPRRWVVQFDDERLRFRRAVVDFDLKLRDHVMVRTAIGYRQRSDGLSRASRTSLTLGLEAQL